MVKLTEKLILARARANELSGVKTLNCWGNGLTDISILEKVPNIEVINASANQIESLEPLSACTGLKELYLRKNQIKSISEITHLKDLRNLRLLWLSGNPFSEGITEEEYRLSVIKYLPHLHKLDNITVSNNELQKALVNKFDATDPSSTAGEDETNSPEKVEDTADPLQIITSTSDNLDGDNEKTKSISDAADRTSSAAVSDDGDAKDTGSESAIQMTLEETNQLRVQLGFKPIQATKLGSFPKQHKPSRGTMLASSTGSNILTATLALVEELNEENLLVVQDAIQERLMGLNAVNNVKEVETEKQLDLLPS